MSQRITLTEVRDVIRYTDGRQSMIDFEVRSVEHPNVMWMCTILDDGGADPKPGDILVTDTASNVDQLERSV